jgi:hypothetical protein
VIDSARYPGNLLQICLSWSALREVFDACCSGGPVPGISEEELVFSGQLGVAGFWRWRYGTPQAHNGINYAVVRNPSLYWCRSTGRYMTIPMDEPTHETDD